MSEAIEFRIYGGPHHGEHRTVPERIVASGIVQLLDHQMLATAGFRAAEAPPRAPLSVTRRLRYYPDVNRPDPRLLFIGAWSSTGCCPECGGLMWLDEPCDEEREFAWMCDPCGMAWPAVG